MKLPLLLLMMCCVCVVHSQNRDGNKTQQIEQLQQLKQNITRKIDTLYLQLTEQATDMETTRHKLDQLKKETDNHDKPDAASKQEQSRLSQELTAMNSLVNKLQKRFDQQLLALDKAVNLQKDLQGKISALVRESNQ